MADPKELVPLFFNKTADSYDQIVAWTTFGKDLFWKHKILEHLSVEKTILDLACGTGILTKQIAKKLPHAKIVGVDVTESYLEKAKEKLASNPNVSFVNQDAEKLDLGEKFDCITASYLPKYCAADVLVNNCARHLRVGGKIILHDFTYPCNRVVQRMWNSYFDVLCLAGFFIADWKQAFVDLPVLIKTSNWARQYEESMRDYGLKTLRYDLTWGCSSIVVGTKIA
jgi:demethylmenaquinone methyltransferase/2-methoxy-6-polyprenyl-1,4-benzoquinol methylase